MNFILQQSFKTALQYSKHVIEEKNDYRSLVTASYDKLYRILESGPCHKSRTYRESWHDPPLRGIQRRANEGFWCRVMVPISVPRPLLLLCFPIFVFACSWWVPVIWIASLVDSGFTFSSVLLMHMQFLRKNPQSPHLSTASMYAVNSQIFCPADCSCSKFLI